MKERGPLEGWFQLFREQHSGYKLADENPAWTDRLCRVTLDYTPSLSNTHLARKKKKKIGRRKESKKKEGEQGDKGRKRRRYH